MNVHRVGGVAVVGLLLAACATQAPTQRTTHAATPTSSDHRATTLSLTPAADKVSEQQTAKVMQGLDMIEHGQVQQAIDGPLHDVIAWYDKTWGHTDKVVFSARDTERSLIYVIGVAADEEKSGKPKKDAVDVGPAWGMAYWAEGYGYNALGEYAQAQAALGKALALAPMNSQYQSELAFTYLKARDWTKALGLYQEAEGNAGLAPQEKQTRLKCVALRGQGYVLVELKRLDDAVKAYQACLKLNPDDPKSRGELRYIQGLRDKAAKPARSDSPGA